MREFDARDRHENVGVCLLEIFQEELKGQGVFQLEYWTRPETKHVAPKEKES